MNGMRLDVRVAEMLGVTRSRAERLIREGHVTVGGVLVQKPGYSVAGDLPVVAVPPPPTVPCAEPEDIPIDILYQDADLAVVNKASGMVVHPAVGNTHGTLVNALLYHLDGLSGIGGTLRPGIVHRLDKDTSGLLLVAKHDASHFALSDALRERRIQKTYRAIVEGRLRDDDGIIEAPIARHPNDRKRMAIVEGGRYARTDYRVAVPLRGASTLDINLITGRTHQIRVHMASIGHPVLGDVIYGGKKPRIPAPRLMLHAWRLAIEHPITHERMTFEAPLPDVFGELEGRLAE